MNRTQIDNLAAQATDDILGVPVLDRYKFAELIVWECLAALAEVDESYIAVFQQHLLEHFEIQE